ncbi:hypothetical protein [Moritella yayanosii]|uniref:Uncharacterized protein n=1 Tax=Moritella yayanosii TaxID=69539 RepID=A0A330LNW6_9GAMM|nr:hypothetical protein [Moritella yayanosii]SQD78684.1 protein of unknown function, might belong to Histidine kinase [Moritella yayanosii]
MAHNSIELLQKEQRMQLTSLSSSYEFQRLLRTDEAELPEWVKHQAENYATSCVRLR